MEDKVTNGYLYDFYGELLNDHQKLIYEDYVINDLSLSEIAEEYGISRQGVHDLIKRCTKTLQGYEDKLHLIEKFVSIRERVNEINLLTGKLSSEDRAWEGTSEEHQTMNALLQDVSRISTEILEEL